MKNFYESAAFAFTLLGATSLFGRTTIAEIAWPLETHDHMDRNYTNYDFNYIVGGRDLHVVMRGDSGGIAQENFTLKVAEGAPKVAEGAPAPGLPASRPRLSATRVGAGGKTSAIPWPMPCAMPSGARGPGPS